MYSTSRCRCLEAEVDAPQAPHDDLETPHPDASRGAPVTHGTHLNSPAVPLRRAPPGRLLARPDRLVRLTAAGRRIAFDDLGGFRRTGGTGLCRGTGKAERQRQVG